MNYRLLAYSDRSVVVGTHHDRRRIAIAIARCRIHIDRSAADIHRAGNGYGYGNGYYRNGYGNGYGYGPRPAVVIAGVGTRGVGVRPGTPANRGGPVNRVGRR